MIMYINEEYIENIELQQDNVEVQDDGKGSYPYVLSLKTSVIPKGRGLKYYFDNISLKINGKEVDPNAEYKVATTEFLSKGGDNYSALGKGEVLGTMGITRDVFVDYLKANKDMAAPKAGRMIKE